MPPITLTWSNLLNLVELDFKPGPPQTFRMSDEIMQTIAWLTAATTHDRRLVRCDENGALLTNEGWTNLNTVENDELYPDTGATDTYTASVENAGVLIATSTQIVKAAIYRVSGTIADTIYIPGNTLYWYPHKTHSIIFTVVPDPLGTASYVGVTAWK